MAGAKLKFDDKKHDFGEKAYRSKVEHDFVFVNEGTKPLIIQGHYTSCPCSRVFYPSNAILPGERGKVTIKYDSTKPGKFYRKIDIKSNAGKVTLIIKGEIAEKGKKKINPITGEEVDG